MKITQSTTQNRSFLMVLSSDHITGATGLTPTVTLSKNGASFAAANGTVEEIGEGWYYIALTTVDTNTPGIIAYHVTATGCDPTDFEDEIISAEEDTVNYLIFSGSTTSYATLTEALDYFDTRHQNRAWLKITDEKRRKYLISATRLIDRLNFSGDKADDDQTLEFPRGDDTTVPTAISIACCEIAYALASGRDPDLDVDATMTVSTGPSQLRTTYQRDFIPEHIVHGIPSAIAWSYLKPYLRDIREITLSRIN
jgi:hypothetical protein